MAASSITLRSRLLELELTPSAGGSVSKLDWIAEREPIPILRKANGPLQKVLDASSFPLVPFVNRIRDGCFRFHGREVRIEPNMAGDPSPLHGQGWTSAWTVAEVADESATLQFEHRPGEWPWAFTATQEFRVESNAVHMRLACRNQSDEPMPCGLGFHPYFRCGPESRIQTSVDQVWAVDENVLPVGRMPATGRYSIADDPVCGRGLDNGYGGWSGVALFRDPDWPFEIELSSADARYFQLYSPAEGGIFVAEPVSHANAALNEPEEDWASLGIRILQPGEAMAIAARIAANPR
jgi:aldose 1-epimerase